MLDELNAALRPHGLRFAPDISTASRATHRRHDGEQLERRALGALRQDDRPRARAARRALGRLGRRISGRSTPSELDAICRGDSLEAACYREVRRLAHEHAPTRSSGAIRRSSAASAATTSTRFVDPDEPFNLAKLMVGSEGTLGVVLEAKIGLVPLPKAKAVLAIQFARSAARRWRRRRRSSRTSRRPSR